MRIRDNTPPPASFQLAPMIDIVFLLLIFFLINNTIKFNLMYMQTFLYLIKQPLRLNR